MSSPLVSIVIPVYNIAPYLERCLKSICSQTYKNLELIAVDDGSTDDSPKILKEYKEKDPRLKVLRQKNSGLSAARNAGLKIAKGAYIAFIDGDDSVEPDYISNLLSATKEADVDLAVCGYTSVKKSSRQAFLPKPEAISGSAATIRLLVAQENLDIVAWNKLYKRELFIKNKITYPVGEPHEDSLTTYKLYASAKKVAYVDKPLYLYYEREGSIMNQSKALTRLKYRERAAREAVAYFAKVPDLKSAAEISLLTSHYAYLDAALRGEIPKSYIDKSLSWIKTHAPAYQSDPSLSKKLKFYLALISTPSAIGYKIFRKIL